uniref:RBR-type E3 ubiquitin transferase n=1 Tax=Clastoptera arizonana TaxID=38151 RepID=A0A1B6EFT1_9HEMI
MGSASSKFKKYLQHGDEFAAMQVYQSSPELRKNLDPNLSYGDSHLHNTALHYAAKHGMKHLLRTFLNDLGGNPNKKNGSNETVLLSACQLGVHKTFSAQERRAACVNLLLQWRGVQLNTGEREKVDLTAQDVNGNTALHCAAQAGLQRCVELLLAHGSPLFAENNDKLTPCDLAMRGEHHAVARLLESKMVFADSNDTINEAQIYGIGEEVYSGLRTQDLQEAKDQLLVETSDMLNIPLFTAEALLRDNEWSRESLLEKWMKDPVQCCQLAGVQPPTSAWQQSGTENTQNRLPDNQDGMDTNNDKDEQTEEIICDICLLGVSVWDVPALMSCCHRFCSACWERYLTVKIQEGDAHHILCPASHCHILVPPEFIEKLVSPEVARRYLQFDIKAFVETNRCIKWCPMAGCGRAVRLPEIEQQNHKSSSQVRTSHAVDCGNGHFFCWECLGEAHAPSGCQQWQQWQSKIAQVKPEQLQATCTETEDAANCLWLVTNCKPCPNCKSPIQKNEGCNHMKCSKCKFDFCWVCLESWKKHSSATGGYFRCNRFEAVHKADEKQGVLISEALLRNQQTTQLNRFLHYYTRFRNHENSRKLEETLLVGVRKKMENLALSLKKGEVIAEANCAKFVEEGVRELLKARRVLCGSYVYGYYLEDNGYSRTIFEFMQNELEEVTEKLSEMVARPYLRTPRSVIVQTTALARRKRHEFARAVSKGLVPPETPPTLRKLRRRNYRVVAIDTNNDADQVHAIAESLKALDSNNPWVKDAQGRHNNLSAIYDWPDFDSDDEEMNHALAVSLLGQCVRLDCTKPRARNPRTCVLHNYCSLHCSQIDKADTYQVNVTADYNMDLVIALEMSRLQMIEDEMKQRQRQENKDTETTAGTSEMPSTGTNEDRDRTSVRDDQQLKLAIKLSLQDNFGSTSPAPESSDYHKTNADLTVDYFLKSLAGRSIDINLNTRDCAVEVISPPNDSIWSTKTCDKEILTGWKAPYVAEDGRFEISDIHEGVYNDSDEFTELDARLLKRSHSTGDLVMRRGRLSTRGEEPRYHLDSDHSSQHEERPEELARRILALPASNRHSLLVQTSGGSTAYCQSSLEDTSDSLNADLEVCGILSTANEDDNKGATLPRNLATIGKKCALDLGDSEIRHGHDKISLSLSSESSEQICDSEMPELPVVTSSLDFLPAPILDINVNKNVASEFNSYSLLNNVNQSKPSLELTKDLYGKKNFIEDNIDRASIRCANPIQEAHRKAFKAAGCKNISSSLRIRICNKSPPKVGNNGEEKEKRPLETDSSNEYESETGIPKSPTLFISGVSISRTPEPKSPALAGRQSRSSSLTVPLPPPPPSPLLPSPLSSSDVQLNSLNTLGLLVSSRGAQDIKSNRNNENSTSNGQKQSDNTKSKSASEPEREREMFRFPKSSTDGALSSVLHIQESNLSSDDFHEALFLLERSPKSNQGSKRRKKSKKRKTEGQRELIFCRYSRTGS